MPDRRKHRGAHPEDKKLFAGDVHDRLRLAAQEQSWLLTRGYSDESALKLVGDRHELTARQRLAVWRCACPDQSLEKRAQTRRTIGDARDSRLRIDGYNLLITIESALSGGLVIIGRDGCYRDLASIHGTYRKVEETRPAIELIIQFLADHKCPNVDWYLDRPVSNSGRLKAYIADVLEARGMTWNIELVKNPDRVLVEGGGLIGSADSWILDRCAEWINIARLIIDDRITGAWIVDLKCDSV